MAREILLATGFEAGSTAFYEAQGWQLPTSSSGSFGGVRADGPRHITRLGVGGSYSVDRYTTTDPVKTPFVDPNKARWLHWWMQGSGNEGPAVEFELGGAAQARVLFGAVSGVITLQRGTSTTLTQTLPGTYVQGRGYWVAVYLHADNAGSMRVFLNGEEVLSFTGDTQALTSPGWDRVEWGRASSFDPRLWIDDVIITDDDAGTALTPIPEVFGQPLVPVEVVSGNLTGVPVAGNGRYANVANLPWDPSQYNEAAAPGDEDLYQMGGFVDMGGDILAVAVCANAYRQGLITQAELQVVSGGTGSYGAPRVLDAAPDTTTWCRYFSEDPAGGAWTPASVNALQAGVRFG